MVTMAGAMSTAEIGKIFAEFIRKDKVQIISCTGANLEEDIMNLVAHSHYERVPHYRDLTPQEEWDLLERGLNRVTDTCIPEHEAFRRLQKHIYKIWKDADDKGERYFPHEFMYKMLLSGVLEEYYEIDLKDSWMYAAAEKNLPIIVPGWEDSTMGNIFASYVIKGDLKASTMKSGIEYMTFLADWYPKNSTNGVGFFQYAWCRCCTKIWKCMMSLFGVIFAKFQILQPVMVPILVLCLMRRLLGENWTLQPLNL